MERTRYYQESREGIYGGTSFLLSNFVQSLPVSVISTFLASFILFRGLKSELLCTESPSTGERSCREHNTYANDHLAAIARQNVPNWLEYSYYPDFVTYWLTLWACYLMAEQQTLALMMVVKSSYTAIMASTSMTILYLVLGSGTVRYVFTCEKQIRNNKLSLRSFSRLPEFLYHLTYITQTRYSGAILNDIEFYNRTSLSHLQWQDDSGNTMQCQGNTFGFGCRYVNGSHYLKEKYGYEGDELAVFMDRWFNFGVCFVFPVGLFIINMILYVIPLPAFVKAKFRE